MNRAEDYGVRPVVSSSVKFASYLSKDTTSVVISHHIDISLDMHLGLVALPLIETAL